MMFGITIGLRIFFMLRAVIEASSQESKRDIEDICQYEIFQPKCLKNEVIFMKSATFGRMRIGRCVTANEISDLQRANLDDTRSYLGCSADVLPILDRKCSGNKDCEVRLSDISAEDVKPCLSGLVVYLEVSYHCISVVDEERSCTVSVSNNLPINIIGSSVSQRICGTTSNPWHVEAPVGQRINIVLLNFASEQTAQTGDRGEQSCNNFGTILDKTGKRNTTICVDVMQREMKIYSSLGNAVHIIFSSIDRSQSKYVVKYVLKLEAIGCSDIIPPEDSWLKRKNDAIQIGCYSSRQTWHLNCQDGKWIGVVGNCSHSDREAVPRDAGGNSESTESTFSNIELVLAIVAIVGFTVAICIAVICIGAICLRRFNRKNKRRDEYKTLGYQVNTVRSQQHESDIMRVASNVVGNQLNGFGGQQQLPLYSVYDGDNELNVVYNTPGTENGNQNFQQL